MTAKLEVNYRRPALLGREFEIQCWIERVDGRKLGLAGEVRDAGEVIADCTSLYVEVDVAHFLKGREAAREGPSLPW